MQPSHPQTVAESRAHMPPGTQTILNSRSLQTAHRRLPALLHPGLIVLDVGCGTGAITQGIANAVAPHGRVVGVDTNATLITEAQQTHRDIPGLSFEVGDVYRLPFREAFDLVHAARVLQWLAHPREALETMATCTKRGGRVVVLDYNHEKIVWTPEPPPSMQGFYRAFLYWRSEAGMDNAIADRLPALFDSAGLVDIRLTPQHEMTQRADADFAVRMGIWAEVAASRGYQMVRDQVVTEPQRAEAEVAYRQWIHAEAASQQLYLLSVEGTRPQ
ncbi:MAG: methyltransferase domain-containing protein [bacterium]|nr:methyltransferase domain-containing protein [bacterium]